MDCCQEGDQYLDVDHLWMYPDTGLYPADSALHPDSGLDHTQDIDHCQVVSGTVRM